MLNKLKEMRESREEGFTLIELLVVIVIIGVLAAIALPIFLNQQKAAIASGVKSDVRNTVTAVATALVKSPTAGAITFSTTAPTSVATTGTKAIVINTATVSDDATVLTVGSTVTGGASPTAVTGAAKWDTYKIFGKNTNAGNPSYGYLFDSVTGKYIENSDIAAAPVVP